MNDDKAHELIDDVTGSGMSNCCGAKVYAPTDEWGICMECKEHCEMV